MPSLLSSQLRFFECQLAGWAKDTLKIVDTNYPSGAAVHRFLQVC
jgi:hypothetical protein